MASDRMWGGLPFIVPSRTAMKYLYHAKVINEDDVPVGAHYRAREDMLNNVRNSIYHTKGLVHILHRHNFGIVFDPPSL